MEKFSSHVCYEGLVALEANHRVVFYDLHTIWIDYPREKKEGFRYYHLVKKAFFKEESIWMISIGNISRQDINIAEVSRELKKNGDFLVYVDNNSIAFFTSNATSCVTIKNFAESITKVVIQKRGLFLEGK